MANNAPRVDILRSPLGRARGLGSSHHGLAHWWGHTLSSIALVPLTLWFICSCIRMIGASREQLADWMSSPIVMALMISTIIATFYHLEAGVNGIFNDYVHQPVVKMASSLALKGACFLLAATCIIAVLKIGL